MTNCKSCRAEIIWATTESGKAMPLNAGGDPAGILTLFQVDGRWRCRAAKEGDANRYTSHFATCPGANEYRKKD